jgi:hypothetical protein
VTRLQKGVANAAVPVQEGFVAPVSEHQRIVAAGWSYRTNDRGWVIYRNPETGRWHTRREAIALITAEQTNGSSAA